MSTPTPEPDDREALADLASRAMIDAWTDESEHTAAPYAVSDAIIAAGFRRHPEPVKPSREDVARALDQVDAEQRSRVEAWARDTDPATLRHAPRMTNAVRADAVLALWPGRSATEVKAAALRETADALARMDDGREGGYYDAGRHIIARIRERADRMHPETERTNR